MSVLPPPLFLEIKVEELVSDIKAGSYTSPKNPMVGRLEFKCRYGARAAPTGAAGDQSDQFVGKTYAVVPFNAPKLLKLEL